MIIQPIRTIIAAVACSLVVPALALVPSASASIDDGPVTPSFPATARATEPARPAEPAAPVAKPVGDTKAPPTVVGSWYYGSISSTTMHDVYTGQYRGIARSMGSFFEFAADGSYKQYTLLSVNNYGWILTTWTETYGTANFDTTKGVVTLAATKGTYKVSDNRVAKSNYDRPMTDEEVKKQSDTRSFKLNRADNGEPRLDLGLSDGKSVMAFKPWERVGGPTTTAKGK